MLHAGLITDDEMATASIPDEAASAEEFGELAGR